MTKKENLWKLVLKLHKSSSSSQAKTQKIELFKTICAFLGYLTKLCRDYIAFFGITNKKSVPGVCAFKPKDK